MDHQQEGSEEKDQYHIILFYQYMPLSDDREILQNYKRAIGALCDSLTITEGRILIGLSRDSEGINGTVANRDKDRIDVFTIAMMGQESALKGNLSDEDLEICSQFWKACQDFAILAGNIPVPRIKRPEDFKWSTDSSNEWIFPDLKVSLVNEIVGTGGKLSGVSIEDTGVGLLSPEAWHRALIESEGDDDTVLIDCRNTYEVAIGHFVGATDPSTKTFDQFPNWVNSHAEELEGKNVLMYCTGGIRCEKASAFVRQNSNAKQVQHLHGGIHKYLEAFPNGKFHGKNFVFDKRLTMSGPSIVGKCIYCSAPHDVYRSDDACTVCRDRVLVCGDCRKGLNREFHCRDHFYLKNCYFTSLLRFTPEQLSQQRSELESKLRTIRVGKKHKNIRRTLQRQIEKIKDRLGVLQEEGLCAVDLHIAPCRNCRQADCDGDCSTFLGRVKIS